MAPAGPRTELSQVFAREAAVLDWEDGDGWEEAAAKTHGYGGKAAETQEGEGKAGQEQRDRQLGKGDADAVRKPWKLLGKCVKD